MTVPPRLSPPQLSPLGLLPLRLAELLAARLCHDLSGQLGALIGAAELAAEDRASAEATALVADAAAALGARLRLLRAAWGGDGAAMAVDEVAQLAAGLAGRRLRTDLSRLDAGLAFAPAAARLVLNVLMRGAECLPRGGVVALAGSPGGDVVATIAGPGATWPPGLAAMLVDPDAAWAALDGPRRLQAPLTVLIAAASGLRLSLLLGGGAPVADAPPPLLLSLRD